MSLHIFVDNPEGTVTDIIHRLIPKADRKKIHEYLFRGMYMLLRRIISLLYNLITRFRASPYTAAGEY